jgi:hypothetical protein
MHQHPSMRILIGGAPSTGSSVFRQILNRHPEIFCGPETYLFIHPELFTHWHEKKHLLVANRLGPLLKNRALSCDSIFFYPSVELSKKEIGNTAARARKWVRKAINYQAFSDRFFLTPLKKYNKHIWAEKSPANARCFDLFIHHFEHARVIHVIRNPYDTIASLLNRGLSLYFAVSVYLFNTAFALKSKSDPAYLELKYEEMIHYPEESIRTLLDRLGLKYSKDMLGKGNPEMDESSKMSGWRYDETDRVRKEESPRFLSLEEAEQEAVKVAVKRLCFDEVYAWKNEIEYLDMQQVMKSLEYNLLEPTGSDPKPVIARLEKEQSAYYRRRLTRLNFTYLSKKPIVIRK